MKHRLIRHIVKSAKKCGAWLTSGHLDGRIGSGPFRTVKLSELEVFGGQTAKLLGTYELELHAALERIKRLQPSVVLNVGGAEGYYAVGMAVAWGVEKVIVYELTTEGRDIIATNANLNGIGEHLDIRGVCTARNLLETLRNESVQLMIMDIEGAELDVLEPDVLRRLKNCIVVIERHDFCRPGCIDELRARFQDTHSIEIITSGKRIVLDFPYVSHMPAILKEGLMDEERPGPMQWLVGYPKSTLSVE